jgi:hypothetical protein
VLPVACCLLPVACCLLPVACCLLPVACCLLPISLLKKTAFGSFFELGERGLFLSVTAAFSLIGSILRFFVKNINTYSLKNSALPQQVSGNKGE